MPDISWCACGRLPQVWVDGGTKDIHAVCVCGNEWKWKNEWVVAKQVTPPVPPPPDKSTRDRLAAEWEAVKHLIPDGELKQFLVRVIMEKMETWAGSEPPRVRPLTVEVLGQDNCDHEFHGKVCQKCGMCLIIEDGPYPHIGPYSGSNFGW